MTDSSKTATSAQNTARQARRVNAIIIVVTLVVIAYLILRNAFPGKPVEFARASATPQDFKRNNSSWTWTEKAEGPNARLVRSVGGSVSQIATAEAIPSYDSDPKHTAWVAKNGNEWTIQVEGVGSPLFKGPNQPRGICISGDRLFWTLSTCSLTPGSVPTPALGPRLTIISQPLAAAGAPSIVAELIESDGRPLGTHGDDLYVQTFRAGSPGSTAIYRVPLKSGSPRRIAGVRARYRAMVTKDGSLYWIAESPNASNTASVSCIRKLGPQDKPVTLLDWIPAEGVLYETHRGLIYIDSGYPYFAWPIETGRDSLPRPLRLPEGYTAVAAGDDELLVRRGLSGPGAVELFKVPLK